MAWTLWTATRCTLDILCDPVAHYEDVAALGTVVRGLDEWHLHQLAAGARRGTEHCHRVRTALAACRALLMMRWQALGGSKKRASAWRKLQHLPPGAASGAGAPLH
eukprot:15442129-Alexandrium_andersonii.AAC.1